MEGQIHRYLGFITTTFLFSAMTARFTGNYKYLYITFGLLFVSSVLLGRVKKSEFERKQKIKEQRKKGEEIEKHGKTRKWLLKNMHKIAYLLLITAIMLTIFTSEYVSLIPRMVSVFFSAFSILVAGFAGATIPDLDWDFGTEYHRNPITHSLVIPIFLWGLSMIVLPNAYRELVILPASFSVGYASHLLADTVPSSVHGIIDVSKAFFNFKQSPGDIRKIPESWEHAWLFLSGVILMACFGISIPRFYGTHGMDYETIDALGNFIWISYTKIFMILSSVFIGVIIGLYVVGHIQYIKKHTKKHMKKRIKK